MKPVFAAAAGQLEPGVRLLTLDTEAEGETAARFGIRSVPTLVLFKGGREAARTSGATDLGSLLGWVRSHLP
jgi:thioredoxin 2